MPYYGGGSTSGVFYECLHNINSLGTTTATYQANSTENTSDWYSSIASSGNVSAVTPHPHDPIYSEEYPDRRYYVFNGRTNYLAQRKYALFEGTYYINVPSGHPIAILNNGSSFDARGGISYKGNPLYKTSKAVTGTDNDGTYDFYHGNVAITVNGTFPDVSYYCSNHGYMGGSGNFVYH